jgi:polyhydroxybutyrate depolymerase
LGDEIGRTARALLGVVVLASVAVVAGVGSSAAAPTGSGAQGCTPRRSAEAGSSDRTLAQDGLERRYQLTIPQGYTGRKAAPLVLNLHGFGGTGESQNTLTDMPELAAERGYVVASPDGGPLKVPFGLVPGAESAGEFEGRPFWNIFGQGQVDFGPPRGQNLNVDSSLIGADDVSFVTQLLDTLERELCIDTRRVYAAGMSNGAGMATTLACALGNRLAAIAPVAGVNLTGKCPGRTPTSVLAVHGDADDTVLYDGNGLLGFQFGNPSVRERMDQWAKRDECRPRPATKETKPGLTVTRWRGCVKGVDVQLLTIAGWEHAWPRATSADQPGVIDATEVALDFFDAHRR